MAQIFVLEDLEDSFQLIKRGIDSGHTFFRASTVEEAKRVFKSNMDLLIVDVGLPDGDGFEFCTWVRERPEWNDIPIIFVSANKSIESTVTGLMVGGDDYVSKPFHMVELRARVEAKLRYRFAKKARENQIEAEGITIDLKARKVFLKDGEKMKDVDLTPIEFKILHYLVEEPGKACDREDILNKVWGKDIYVYHRSVDTHVSKLRKKLGPKGDLIRSVHGTGYRFVPHGEESAGAPQLSATV